MTRVLKIRMNMPSGKTLTWSLQNPLTTLTSTQVKTVIDNMLNMSLILYNNEEPSAFRDAYIYETNTIELN